MIVEIVGVLYTLMSFFLLLTQLLMLPSIGLCRRCVFVNVVIDVVVIEEVTGLAVNVDAAAVIRVVVDVVIVDVVVSIGVDVHTDAVWYECSCSSDSVCFDIVVILKVVIDVKKPLR